MSDWQDGAIGDIEAADSIERESTPRLAMVSIPRSLLDPGGHRPIPVSRAEGYLRDILGDLPPGMSVQEVARDTPTQRLLIVLEHPGFRPFRDGNTLVSVDIRAIASRGWSAIMEAK